ncbi:hypothetical protein D3C75_453500 [compost metagenome]
MIKTMSYDSSDSTIPYINNVTWVVLLAYMRNGFFEWQVDIFAFAMGGSVLEDK